MKGLTKLTSILLSQKRILLVLGALLIIGASGVVFAVSNTKQPSEVKGMATEAIIQQKVLLTSTPTTTPSPTVKAQTYLKTSPAPTKSPENKQSSQTGNNTQQNSNTGSEGQNGSNSITQNQVTSPQPTITIVLSSEPTATPTPTPSDTNNVSVPNISPQQVCQTNDDGSVICTNTGGNTTVVQEGNQGTICVQDPTLSGGCNQ